MANDDFCKNLLNEPCLDETRYSIELYLGEGTIADNKKQELIQNMLQIKKGNLKGNGQRLKKNMIKIEMLPYMKHTQTHHLLPTEIAKSGKYAILEKAKTYGYDIDNAHNGIHLPTIKPKKPATTSISASVSGFTVHKGPHPPQYLQGVECLLDDVEKSYESSWSEERVLEEIQGVEEKIWLLVYHEKLPIRKIHIGKIKKGISKAGLLVLKDDLSEQKELLVQLHSFFNVKLDLINAINETLSEIDERLNRA